MVEQLLMEPLGGCPFCEIVASDPRGQIEEVIDGIEGREPSIVITPLDPVVPGHKLVIPTVHVRDLREWPGVSADVMCHVADYLKRSGLGDCNVITSVGPGATQTVFHLHVHIVPRRHGDGLALPWTTGPLPLPARSTTALSAERMREEMFAQYAPATATSDEARVGVKGEPVDGDTL